MIIKIRVGDVFSIPISNGNFGLGQILKLQTPNISIGAAFMVLFDKELPENELDNIDYGSLKDTPILSGMPLDSFRFRSRKITTWKRVKWKIHGNTTPVDYPIPMFHVQNNWRSPDCLLDFGSNYFRPASPDEIDRTEHEFTRDARYFETLLDIRFVDPTIRDGLPSYWEHFWPQNYISEEDMVTNAHRYHNWKDFWLNQTKDGRSISPTNRPTISD
jgi:hypothetical protein